MTETPVSKKNVKATHSKNSTQCLNRNIKIVVKRGSSKLSLKIKCWTEVGAVEWTAGCQEVVGLNAAEWVLGFFCYLIFLPKSLIGMYLEVGATHLIFH